MAKFNRIVWLLIASISLIGPAAGQEMRIRTRVYLADAPEPFTTCLSLFHAGKVYDYIEPLEEITIYEPALQRFTIINKARQLKSEITQDEIRHFLTLAQNEAAKHATDPTLPRKAADFLQVQLNPDFTASFDADKSQLTLGNATLQYIVQARDPERRGVAEKYLHVADWTAQCNSVLHPKTLLPAPRMALNQELRSRGMVPLTVELKAETDPAIHLIARHEWTWNLIKTDRQLIDNWEQELKNPAIQSIDFRRFQQEMLRSPAGRKR